MLIPALDRLMAAAPPWIWTVCSLGLFLLTMVWAFTLRKEYVNLDAPHKGVLYDLRFWVIVSMLPHLVVYFWFSRL